MRLLLLLIAGKFLQAKTVKKPCEKNYDLMENEETNINIHLKETISRLRHLHRIQESEGRDELSWDGLRPGSSFPCHEDEINFKILGRPTYKN